MFLADGFATLLEVFEVFLCALLAAVANSKGADVFFNSPGFLLFADRGGLESYIEMLCLTKAELSLTCSISEISPLSAFTFLGGDPLSMLVLSMLSIY